MGNTAMLINDYLVIAMFLTFIALLFTGYPIPFVLAGVAAIFTLVGYLADIYLGAFTGLDFMYVGMVVNRIYKLMDNWVLVAVPMFIFMGLMLDRAGVAEKMMLSMQDLFGKVRGGLAVTVCCQAAAHSSSPQIFKRHFQVVNVRVII